MFQLVGKPVEFVVAQSSISNPADQVEQANILLGLVEEHVFDSVVAVFLESGKQLDSAEHRAGFDNELGIDVGVFLEKIDSGFHFETQALGVFLIFDPILVAAFFPIGEILEVDALAGIAEFVKNHVIRQAVVEHAVNHVASGAVKSGDFAVAPGAFGDFRSESGGIDGEDSHGDE